VTAELCPLSGSVPRVRDRPGSQCRLRRPGTLGPTSTDRREKETVKVRNTMIGAALVCASTAAVTLVGGNAAQAAAPVCSIQTSRGDYVTAVGGGGRTTDVMHTNATAFSSWERFALVYTGVGSSHGIRTNTRNYVTAVNSGGLSTAITHDVLHTDATSLQDWEKFTFASQSDGTFGIRAFDGHFLTAIDGGGRTTDAFDSNRSSVQTWEKFRINCGL
jgi:hypothetical protein